MKKEYVSPVARIIELQMNENIAKLSESFNEKLGGWKFTHEVVDDCFKYVTTSDGVELVPSGYTDAASMKDFSSTFYSWTLEDNIGRAAAMAAWSRCAT